MNTISEGARSAVRIQRHLGNQTTTLWAEPLPFSPAVQLAARRSDLWAPVRSQSAAPLRNIKPARQTETPATVAKVKASAPRYSGCAPGMGCHQLKECADIQCPGHPLNNPPTKPATHILSKEQRQASAMFWRIYIGVAVFALLALWVG